MSNTNKTVCFNFVLSPVERKRLDQLAKADARTASDILRRLINEAWTASKSPKAKPKPDTKVELEKAYRELDALGIPVRRGLPGDPDA